MVRLLLGLAPIVAATAIAGATTLPSAVRPCAVEYSAGIHSHPIHLILGPDGDLYATENFPDAILRFDPNTHKATEYPLPRGTLVHDAAPSPDGNVWFVTLTDKLAFLNPRDGRVTWISGITRGSQPHSLVWDRDGSLYITEQLAGRIARYNPVTHKITERTAGLPPGNWIHNIVQLPDGDLWAVLQHADELAHFNIRTQRFDQFVRVPIKDAGPRDITYVRSRNALYVTLYAANKLLEYDISTGKLSTYSSPFKAISLAKADGRTTIPKLTFVRPDATQKYVWMATLGGGELLRFDLQTHAMKQVHCGITFPDATLGVATDREGRLWFIEPLPGRIGRIMS
jgi:streptogramin lyase